MALQTEFEFTLPRGYVDREGNVHRHGVMRLATAMDEIAPMRDQRVRANQAYLVIILLARVVIRLGDLRDINTGVIEALFSADLAFLQDFYRRINETGTSMVEVICPECDHHFEIEVGRLGVIGYPLDRLYEEVAYIAYHFHWPLKTILAMEHLDRQTWVEQIGSINNRLNEASEE